MTEAVDRQTALFADLHGNALGRAFLQRIVFVAQAFQLGSQVLIGHGNSGSRRGSGGGGGGGVTMLG